MLDHWELNGPPVYIAVAAYLGLIKEDKKSSKDYGDLDDLAAMFAGSGGMIQ